VLGQSSDDLLLSIRRHHLAAPVVKLDGDPVTAPHRGCSGASGEGWWIKVHREVQRAECKCQHGDGIITHG
jgi:hypothetical protein